MSGGPWLTVPVWWRPSGQRQFPVSCRRGLRERGIRSARSAGALGPTAGIWRHDALIGISLATGPKGFRSLGGPPATVPSCRHGQAGMALRLKPVRTVLSVRYAPSRPGGSERTRPFAEKPGRGEAGWPLRPSMPRRRTQNGNVQAFSPSFREQGQGSSETDGGSTAVGRQGRGCGLRGHGTCGRVVFWSPKGIGATDQLGREGEQIVSSEVEHSFAIRSVAGSIPVRSSQDETRKSGPIACERWLRPSPGSGRGRWCARGCKPKVFVHDGSVGG